MTFLSSMATLFASLVLAFASLATAHAADTTAKKQHGFEGVFSEAVDSAGRHYFKLTHGGEDVPIFQIKRGSLLKKDSEIVKGLKACIFLKPDLYDDRITVREFVYKDEKGKYRILQLDQLPKLDGFGRPIQRAPFVKQYDCSESYAYSS